MIILIFSVIGSLASIFAFGVYFTPSLNNQGWLGVLFLGLLTLFFLGYNYYLIFKYRKKVRYAEIFEDINIGFASLHRVDREDAGTQGIIKYLIELCNSVSDAFSNVNGHHIGVCIKFLTFDNNRPLVYTLVRDRKSSTKNRKTGKQDKIKHWLDGNSDFDFIYSNFNEDNIDTAYYFAENLPCKKDYRNTRLTKNWPPRVKLFLFDNVIRQKEWPLKYKCTIVVPIVPLIANEQEQSALRGFLCIDSPRNFAFNKLVDVEILKGISDGLYNKIDKLHALI